MGSYADQVNSLLQELIGTQDSITHNNERGMPVYDLLEKRRRLQDQVVSIVRQLEQDLYEIVY